MENKTSGKVMGSHKTMAEAKKQMEAIHANTKEKMSDVKVNVRMNGKFNMPEKEMMKKKDMMKKKEMMDEE